MYAENFKKIRKAKGYTQQSFAKELGIKRGTYSAYEENRTEPPIRMFFKICSKLEITMEQALTKQISIEINVL